MPLNINSTLDLSPMASANPYAGMTGGPGDLAALGANYGRQQAGSTDVSKQQYQNVMGGYQSLLDNHAQQSQAIAGNYGQLSADVLGGIKGIDASQRQAIQDAYVQQQGAASQNLQSRGLANSTVVDSTNRGLMFDKQKADVALSNATAGLTAGYQSQLGLAGLGYQGQALQQQTQLGQGQVNAMERVNVGYPNAGAYQQVAQQIGAAQQGRQNHDLAMAGIAMQRPTPTGSATQPGGGQGFFGSNPYAYTGGGGGSPMPMGGGQQQRGPAAPSMFDQPSSVGAITPSTFGGYSPGLPNYTPPSGQGFGGAIGDQGYGYGPPPGEDQPYGQPQPGMSVQPGGWSPYGNGAAMGQGPAIDANLNGLSQATDFYFGD